jgi:hypothetical protein
LRVVVLRASALRRMVFSRRKPAGTVADVTIGTLTRGPRLKFPVAHVALNCPAQRPSTRTFEKHP